MKKYVNKLKRIVAVILSMALVISLFQSDILRTFADENATTPVLDFVPEGATLEENKMNEPYPVAYVKNNEITLYADFVAGAQGAVYTGAQGEQIDLANSYTYTAGDEKVILYKYEYHEIEGVMYNARNEGYMFISAEDISYTEVEKPETTPAPTPEVTASPEITPNPTPEVIPTSTPEATQDPEGGIITLDFIPNDVYANSAPATEKYAAINDTIIRVYKSPDYQAEGVELTVNAGTVIELVTAYTYSDGQVVYRYDYNGVENSALYNAALSELSGYPIIPAQYITVGVETVENTTITDLDTFVSVTGLLPKTAELDTVPTTISQLPEGTDTADINENALFYDFTLSNGGAYFEPSSTVKVTFPEKNLNFAQGTEYTIFHVDDNGEVTTLGIETYTGGDIQVDVDGFSYIGLSADVEFVDIEDFRAQFKVNPVTLYADTALVNSKEFATADTDIITIEMKAIANDGNNKVELYVIAYNGYEGENSKMKEAITPSNGMAYAYVKVGDVKEYKEPIQDEPELEDTALVDEDTGITVSGSLPVGTTLSIKEVSLESTGLDTTVYPVGEHSMVYDVSLTYNGKEYQPEGEVYIEIPEDQVVFGFASGYMVYHIHGKEVDTIGPVVYTGGFINLPFTDFSHFVYTDTFTSASNVVFKGGFTDNYVTFYEAPFENAMTYSIENALDHFIYAEFSYTDANGVIWHKFYNSFVECNNEYLFVRGEDVRKILTDEVSGITVTGSLPVGVTVTVSAVYNVEDVIDTNKYSLGADTVAYNISLSKDDETYQPESSVDVTFPASLFSKDSGTYYAGYHIHDGEVDILGAYQYTGEDVVVTVDSFSYILLTETDNVVNLVTDHNGLVTSGVSYYNESRTGTIISDNAVLYTGYDDNSLTTTLTGAANTEILVLGYVEYGDGTIIYYYDPTINNEFDAAVGDYAFIASEDVSFGVVTVDGLVVEDKATGITVMGTLPKDVKLNVTPITDKLALNLDVSYPIGEHFVAYDISLTLNGQEYQPEGEVYLEIPESQVPFSFASGYNFYHIHDNTVEVVGPIIYTGGFINLPVTTFSQFVYTDVYAQASNVPFKAGFNSNYVTFYTSPLADAETYAIENALDHFTYVEFSYTEADGTVWHKFYNDIVECDSEYLFVKGTDVREVNTTLGTTAANFTNVAPVTNTTISTTDLSVKQTASLYNMKNLSLMARNVQLFNAEPADTDGNGLIISKDVSAPVDGVYTITLEAYVTGNVEIKRQSMPTDIILVLDQSGSMDDTMGGNGYFEYTNTAANAFNYYRNNFYIKNGSDYIKVNVTRNSETTTRYDVYNNYNGEEYNGWYYDNSRRNNLHYKDGDEYYQVTVSRTDRNGTYTYTYIKDGETITLATSDGRNTNPNLTLYGISTQTTYTGYTFTPEGGTGVTYGPTESLNGKGYYYYGTDNRSKLQILKDTVTDFATAVVTDANGADGTRGTEDDVDHHLAIVGFGRANYGDSPYYNTELFVGGTQYQYGGTTISAQYANALQDMNTESGVNNITASIADLDGEGGTYVDLGIEMANNIWAAKTSNGTDFSRYVDGDGNVIRNRVVIVFTDGAPGYNGEWNNNSYGSSGDAKAVAEEALEEAKVTKNTYGATVYTIGIFSGADASITVSTDKKSVTLGKSDNSNKFMHYLSSNYTPAANVTPSMTTPGTQTFPKDTDGNFTGDSYYLSAGDSAALGEIFDKISTSISGSSNSQLTSTTVVKDIISPYFKLPAGASENSIVVTTEKRTYNETDKTYGWLSEGALTDASINIDDKTIDVSGFDFKANYVATTARKETESSENIDFYGRKLVIEIPIVVEPDFLGGNNVPTNGALSGVYESSDAEEPVEAFEVPDVDVALKKINPVLEDQYIYVTNSADLDDMLAGTDADARYEFKFEGSDIVYDFDGENNGFVNVTYTIKEGENIVKTLTIPAKAISGSWTDASALIAGLTTDKTYSIECTITPSTAGSIVQGTTGSDTGTVYVFKPTVTFEDKGVYYGQVVPTTEQLDAALVADSLVWTNGIKAYNAGLMSGDEPSLDYNYSYNAGTTVGYITTTDDIPVTATVIVTGEITSTTAATVVHQKACDITGTECETTASFLLHVFTPEFETKDTTGYLGDEVPKTDGLATNEIWKHKNNTPDAANMVNTKPTLIVETTPGTGVENGIIVTTNDIPVQATVAIGTTDVTKVVKFNHTNCSGKTCTLVDDAELLIHVNTVSLNVSKEVTGSTNTSGEFKVVVAFEGNNFDNALKILEDNADATLNVVDGKASLNLTLTHGQTVKLTNLPVGRYTVTEDDYSARYNTTVTGGTMVSNRSACTDLARGKVEDTIAFVNELKAGYLTIKKVIEMPKGFVASTTDEFTIVVKQGDTQFASVTLKNGETCSPIELVAGTYTVVETVKGTLYGDHASQNHTVTIEAGETTETTVTNPAKTGSLEVSKTIVNEAVNYDSIKDTFDVKVKVDGYTGTALDYTIGGETKSASVATDGYVTITLAHDQSALFKGLLANVTYNVMEVLSTDQQTVYKTPVITNGTSTIAADSTQEATITNTVKTGTLVIDKNISLPEGVSVADNETFAFKVTGPNGYSKPVTITKDGEHTISNLLVGEYNVVENLTAGQAKIYTTSYSPEGGKATVQDGTSTTVTVTNTVTAGNLEITKTVEDKAENISPDKKFTVEITFAGDIVINSLEGTVAGDEQTVPVTDGKATVSLANGEKVSFTNIPIGVTYTVTEKGVDTSYYTVSYSNETGMISADTPLVTVTNTRNYGKLTITKVVKDDNGNIIPANPGETFLFTVTDGRGFEMQVVIAPDVAKPGSDSVTLNNLPIGDYAVTEDTSWSYKYATDEPSVIATITTTMDGQATITNVPKTDKWLKADAYAENVFAEVASTK